MKRIFHCLLIAILFSFNPTNSLANDDRHRKALYALNLAERVGTKCDFTYEDFEKISPDDIEPRAIGCVVKCYRLIIERGDSIEDYVPSMKIPAEDQSKT